MSIKKYSIYIITFSSLKKVYRPITFVIVLILSGCIGTAKMYPGPTLKKEETAYISMPCQTLSCVKDYSVDGNALRESDGAYVLPGPHKISVFWKGTFKVSFSPNYYGRSVIKSEDYCVLKFDARANKTYRIFRSGITLLDEGRCSKYGYERGRCPEKEYAHYSANAYLIEDGSDEKLAECSIGSGK